MSIIEEQLSKLSECVIDLCDVVKGQEGRIAKLELIALEQDKVNFAMERGKE